MIAIAKILQIQSSAKTKSHAYGGFAWLLVLWDKIQSFEETSLGL